MVGNTFHLEIIIGFGRETRLVHASQQLLLLADAEFADTR